MWNRGVDEEEEAEMIKWTREERKIEEQF
jgi:hypothetical protein